MSLMASFTQTYIIQAPAHQVWLALTDPDIIEEWGAGPATMDDTVGDEFELWGGDIWGKNIVVIRNKQLKQEWFAGDWEQPSIVTFDFSGKGNETTVVLTHENVPDAEAQSLAEGWLNFYFEPIKKLLENTVNS